MTPGFEKTRHLNEICKALFEKTEITYFECIRFHHARQSLEWVSTNPLRTSLWTIDRKIEIGVPMMWYIHNTQFRYFFWDSVVTPMESQLKNRILDFMKISHNEFNISHGFVITELLSDFSIYYSFGTSAGKEHMHEFYINKLNLITNFVHLFKEKAFKIFEPIIEAPTISTNHSNRESLEDFYVKRYYLNPMGINPEHYLTAQEMRSVLLLSRGSTIKEIAFALNISARTVEAYFKSAKIRLDLKNNHQLIEAFWNSSLAVFANTL